MCLLSRRQLDPKTRRIQSAGYLCLASSFVPTLFHEHGVGHSHSAVFDALRFLLLGLAIGLLYWSVRRSGGCASRS
jgi:hypothetical protein